MVRLTTAAELAGLVLLPLGCALVWGIGGLIAGIGAALLYEARS